MIEAIYKIKGQNKPDYYLENNYRQDADGCWIVSSTTYMKHSIKKAEIMVGPIRERKNPISIKDHPENKTLHYLLAQSIFIFQSLIGLAVYGSLI